MRAASGVIEAALAALAMLAGGCGGGGGEAEARDGDLDGAAPELALGARPVVALADNHGAPLIGADDVARLLQERREDWYALRSRDRKVGWSQVVMRPAEDGEPGGYGLLVEGMFLYDEQESWYREERYYDRAPPHRLVELRTWTRDPRSTAERRFLHAGDVTLLAAAIDGRLRWPRWLPPSTETAAAMMTAYAVPPTVEAGQSVEIASLDVLRGRDRRTTVTIETVAVEPVSGVPVPVVTARLLYEGDSAPFLARFAGGRALSYTMGDGLQVELTDQASAQADVEGLTMEQAAVEIDRELGDLASERELTLRLTAPPGFTLPSGPHQQVRELAPGEYEVVLRAVPGPEVTAAEREAALRPTLAFDSDARAIIERARSLTAGLEDDRARVDRLVDWVYQRLDKQFATELSSASHVLSRGYGDCTEHTLLLVALARAAGVPAREVSGLMYGPGTRRFYWHAWAQVAIDGRWVAVDGAWGQRIADPGHLILGIGDDHGYVALMGSLRLAAP